jgi:NAD(P)-dependent dehydrogenase (short-subunit alcohol dehydrogenase family)
LRRDRTRNALVTGASGGIGAEVVLGLARSGTGVTAVARKRAGLEALTSRLEQEGLSCDVLSADLSRPKGPALVLAALEGRQVDILVNNVGGAPMHPVFELTASDWTTTLEKNLLAAVRLSAGLVPSMCDRGWGRVVNVGSIAGLEPHPQLAAYAAAKAGLLAYSKSLSKAVADRGVTVNTVVPGAIETDGFGTHAAARAEREHISIDEARKQLIAEEAGPSGRCGFPHDVAAAILFFTGEDADYITGASLVVDGGTVNGVF